MKLLKFIFADDQTCISLADSHPEDSSLGASSVEIRKAPHITSSFITERVAPSWNTTRPELARIIPSTSFIIYRKRSPCLCSYTSYTFVRSPRCCTAMPCRLSQKPTLSRSTRSLIAYQRKLVNDERRKRHRSESAEPPKSSKTRMRCWIVDISSVLTNRSTNVGPVWSCLRSCKRNPLNDCE